MKKLIIVLFFTLFSSNAFSSGEDAIKGFAKFQAGRVENIILNEMVYQIDENRYFKQLFPLTKDAIDNYGDTSGKRLIPLIQYFIKKDLDNIEGLSQCVASHLYKRIETIDNPVTIREQAEKIYTEIQGFLDNSKNNIEDAKIKYCKDNTGNDLTYPQIASIIGSSEIIDKLDKILIELKKTYTNEERSHKKYLIERKYQYWKNIYDYLKEANTGSSNYIKMHYVILSLDKLGLNDGDKFYDFRNLAMFLAQLSDVADKGDNGEAAKAIIENYIDSENDSFNKKRIGLGLFSNYCTYFLCNPVIGINSYFGIGYAEYKEAHESALYGPLGIEMRLFNYYGHMTFLGYAPIDIGIPIKNELTDKQYSTSWDDIRNDSLYVSYSYKHKPFALIFSYHKDNPATPKKDDSYYMISVAFDLPLYFF